MTGSHETTISLGGRVTHYYVPEGRTMGDVEEERWQLPHDGTISQDNSRRLTELGKIMLANAMMDFLAPKRNPQAPVVDIFINTGGVIRPPRRGPTSADFPSSETR